MKSLAVDAAAVPGCWLVLFESLGNYVKVLGP